MLDVTIVLAFVAYSVTAGFRSRRAASRNLEEYFLAGRTLTGWRAGLSMAATQYAADTPLLAAGLIATGGLFSLWRLWIYGLAFLMMGFLLGVAWRRSGVLTDAELVAIRYSGDGVLALRGLKAIYFGTVINCTVLAMVLVAATRICETFLPWHEWLPSSAYGRLLDLVTRVGVPLDSGVAGLPPFVATTDNLISIGCILLFVGLYSTTGGLRGVVATDIAQLGLILLATAIYAIWAVRAAGGPTGMIDALSRQYGSELAGRMTGLVPRADEALLPFLTVVGLQWLFQMNSDGTGYLAQRTMGCRSDADARWAGFVMTWTQIVVRSLLWLPIGVALLVIYPFDPSSVAGEGFAAARELTFVTGIQDLMPAGIRGVMLTGLLAALASTIDTHLNWGAGYWSNDIYRAIVNRRWLRREPGAREMVLVARLSNVLVLGIALAVMANLDSIQTAWRISLLFGAGIGSVLVLRWFWERIGLWSELAAMAVSLAAAPAILVLIDAEWLRLSAMAAVSTLAVVAAVRLGPPTDPAVLDAFYRRVRPPGAWGATAARVGEDPAAPARAFRTGATLVLATASTVFLTLIGGARLLIPSQGGSRLVGLVWLLLAAATVPLWWRRVFGKPGV